MPLGNFSFAFISSPAKFEKLEFLGVGFIVIALAVYWSHFVNDLG